MTKARTWVLGKWQITASPGMDVRISENVENGAWATFSGETIDKFIRALERRRDSSYYAAPELEFRIMVNDRGCIAFPLWQVPDWIDVLQLARTYATVLPEQENNPSDATAEDREDV